MPRFSSARSRPGTTRRSRSSTRTPNCRRRRSPSCIAPTVPGTTFNFTDYLSKASADWKSKVGTNTAVEWPVGIGAKGNEGVANNVAQTKGSIGYVEYAYAKQNKLTFTKMINKDGKTVAPTIEAFQAAAANADWNSEPGYGVILANQPGAKSWPMTAATFILIHKQPKDPAAAAEALKFFAWAYAKGGKMAEDLDYVPMPAKVVGRSRRSGRPRSRTRAASRSTRWRTDAIEGKGAIRRLFLACPPPPRDDLCGDPEVA